MSWAEVKQINSNMSKPLDELIIGEKRFVAGSDALAVLSPNEVFIGRYETKYLGSFSPYLLGSIRAEADFKLSGGDSSDSCVFYVYENGNKVVEKRFYYSSTIARIETFDINIEAGKQYTFEIYCDGLYVDLYHFKICGQVTDYNYFSFTSI